MHDVFTQVAPSNACYGITSALKFALNYASTSDDAQAVSQAMAHLRSLSKTDSLCPLSVRDTERSKPEVCCSSPTFDAESFLSAAEPLPASAAGLPGLGSGEVRLSGGL